MTSYQTDLIKKLNQSSIKYEIYFILVRNQFSLFYHICFNEIDNEMIEFIKNSEKIN